MLQPANTQAKQHWTETDELVSRWLKERQELIVLYCAIDGLREFTPQETPIAIKVHAFCQVLIDYMSAWHFEIHKKLLEEAAQFNEDINTLVVNTLDKIQESTNVAVDFNDKYTDNNILPEHFSALAQDMSELGESMVSRFDLEDQLIDILHNSHRDQVA